MPDIWMHFLKKRYTAKVNICPGDSSKSSITSVLICLIHLWRFKGAVPLSTHLSLQPRQQIVQYYRKGSVKRNTWCWVHNFHPPSILMFYSDLVLVRPYGPKPHKCLKSTLQGYILQLISFNKNPACVPSNHFAIQTQAIQLKEGNTLLIQTKMLMQTHSMYEIHTSDLSANLWCNQKCWTLKTSENASFSYAHIEAKFLNVH